MMGFLLRDQTMMRTVQLYLAAGDKYLVSDGSSNSLEDYTLLVSLHDHFSE